MLKIQPMKKPDGDTAAKVTFVLPLANAPQPVSVTGDFNDWDPLAHPLRKRSNGTRSVSIEIDTPASVQFKYLAEDGQWFNEPEADRYVVNEYAETNSVLDLDFG
jgi:1,4-alpha-glucan branching enzyme